MIKNQKIEVEHLGRKVLVYPWAMDCAWEICSATYFTRMVMPGTDPQIYIADLITDFADNSVPPA